MKPKLGKIMLLKNKLKDCLENNKFEEAETVLKVINEEYKNVKNKDLLDILNSNQIENIEKCFGKNLKDILGNQEEYDKGIEQK